MLDKLKKALANIEGLDLRYDHKLKEYTSFKIGGKADIFAIPKTKNTLIELLQLLQDYQFPFFILGKGSNIIVGDKGYRGMIIYTGELKNVNIEGTIIKAEAGITLAALANKALAADLSGLEFASGIPGSLGGALYMNAGAYGSEMKDVVRETSLLDYAGNEYIYSKEELALSYRYSILQKKPLIVLTVSMELEKGNKEEIKAKMLELNRRRKEKQPLEWPSAGSIFKRPEGHYVGPMIEELGLKGYRIGDAQISEKHAGFIINLGNATAADVIKLIKLVQDKIYKEKGIKLEPEPRFIGEF